MKFGESKSLFYNWLAK